MQKKEQKTPGLLLNKARKRALKIRTELKFN
jgi:hypothetical protein